VLVAIVDSIRRLRHEMADIVQQRRCDERWRRPVALGQGGRLQRMGVLRHALAIGAAAITSEARQHVVDGFHITRLVNRRESAPHPRPRNKRLASRG
jgi:hypothetical protein